MAQPTHKRGFLTTQWTMVTNASNLQGENSSSALEKLCLAYWQPVYAYVLCTGRSSHDSEDITQQFFLQLLEKESLSKADRERGKFRSFLISCLKNFLHNSHRSQVTQKRGGRVIFVEFDAEKESEFVTREQGQLSDPEIIFDRRWADTLVHRARTQLISEWRQAGRPIDALSPYLVQSKMAEPMTAVSERLDISLAALKSAIHRMRQRFAQLIREEVANTVADPQEVEGELKNLLTLLTTQ